MTSGTFDIADTPAHSGAAAIAYPAFGAEKNRALRGGIEQIAQKQKKPVKSRACFVTGGEGVRFPHNSTRLRLDQK